MKLTVVGMSGSCAGAGSSASSYLLEHEADGRTWRIVLDLGSGSFGALQNYVDPFDIDALLLSHMHPDHSCDIAGLKVYLKYHPQKGRAVLGGGQRLVTFGPQDLVERTVSYCGFDSEAPGSDESAREVFDFQFLLNGVSFQVGPFAITPFEMNHPVSAFGFRISVPTLAGVKTFAYTGDTDLCANLDPLSAQADLFLAEAAYVKGRDDAIVDLHLTGAKAGQVAERNGVKKLILTHIPPWNDPAVTRAEAADCFAGEIHLAQAGQVYEV